MEPILIIVNTNMEGARFYSVGAPWPDQTEASEEFLKTGAPYMETFGKEVRFGCSSPTRNVPQPLMNGYAIYEKTSFDDARRVWVLSIKERFYRERRAA